MTASGPNEVASHELPATALDPEIAAARAGKIKVSMISLCGCWGCSLSLLDIDERMIDLLDKITILRSSFTDIKRIPQRCAIGFIEGEGKGLKTDPTAKVVGLEIGGRGKACPSCGQYTMHMSEGCMTCASCGHSKCG